MKKKHFVVLRVVTQVLLDLGNQCIVIIIANPGIKKVAENIKPVGTGRLIAQKAKKTANNVGRVMAEMEVGDE